MMESMARRLVLTAAIAMSCLIPDAVAIAQAAQAPPRSGIGRWGLVDALGYGGMGFAAGVVATFSDDLGDESLGTIGALTLVGLLGGAALGQSTVHRIRAGRAISGPRRFAVSTGAILGGATLGALASVPLINGEGEGTPLGSDESAFALLTGTGAALGVLYVLRHASDFRDARVALTPVRTIDAAHGIRVTLRF